MTQANQSEENVDVGKEVLNYLLELETIQEWLKLQEILKQAASNAHRDWRLPLVACMSVGGIPEKAIPSMAAIACSQISILLIDDVLDEDPRGEYLNSSVGEIVNIASALQSLGLQAFSRCEAPCESKLEALRILNQMMLTTALGQHMDIQNPQNEEAYWQVVRTKSSPFYGAALRLGALFGDATPENEMQIERIGQIYGEMIQIHDDLNDVMASPANPDWTLGRSPLPILFTQTVKHPDRDRFLRLRRALPDPEALMEAQRILIKCGAISFAVDLLVQKHQAAGELIKKLALVRREGLEKLLDDVIQPVLNLFAAVGMERPETML